MSIAKLVRVGKMPGGLNEFNVTIGTRVSDVLSEGNISTDGHDVKVDGVKVDPYDAVITGETNTILLVKQVKGN